jgi:hypothetical protein
VRRERGDLACVGLNTNCATKNSQNINIQREGDRENISKETQHPCRAETFSATPALPKTRAASGARAMAYIAPAIHAPVWLEAPAQSTIAASHRQSHTHTHTHTGFVEYDYVKITEYAVPWVFGDVHI